MTNKTMTSLSEAEKEFLLEQASILMKDFFVIEQTFNDAASFNKMVKNLFTRPIANKLRDLI
jgi:hypothetical protein